MRSLDKNLLPILFIAALGVSCDKKEKDMEEGIVSYSMCHLEENYIDTTDMKGYACLFNDSVPEAVKKELQQSGNTLTPVAWIVYERDVNSAMLYVSSQRKRSIGIICNYPEFAKQWEISTEGQKVYYEGIAFKIGEYLGGIPVVGYDIALTILRREK